MKDKNLPDYNNSKSLEELTQEVNMIIEKLENTETNLEDSIEWYDRMNQLNAHIQDKFRQKANEIRKSTLSKNKKKLFNNSK